MIVVEHRSTSQAEAVFTAIRAEILACALLPGTKLRIADFGERFGMSLAAVREALSRLTAEGLVVAEPQKGFRVAPVSIADLEDLTKARIFIEAECLRRSIQVGSLKWEGLVVSQLHQLNHTPQTLPDGIELNPDWEGAHEALHDGLASACDSQWLLRIRKMLFEQSRRYRYLAVTVTPLKRDLGAEHQRIVDAAIARNTEEAVAALVEHIQTTSVLLLDAESLNPTKP